MSFLLLTESASLMHAGERKRLRVAYHDKIDPELESANLTPVAFDKVE